MNDAERFFSMAPAPGSAAAMDLGCRCDAAVNFGGDGQPPTEPADVVIFDDIVVTEPPSRERVQEALALLRESGLLPEMTRGGAYRNAAGELVTWDASEDGGYVTVSTWPQCAYLPGSDGRSPNLSLRPRD